MLTDYKVSRRIDLDDGRIELLVRFYEGDVTTAEDEDPAPALTIDGVTDETRPVTRYRRFSLLSQRVYTLPAGTDVKYFLNTELAKSETHTPVAEQSNA